MTCRVPEGLFEGGPEWEWWEKVGCWRVLIAGQIHVAKRAPAGGWILGHDVDVEGGDGTWCESDDVGWLRSRIIAHRDELNRVTGAGLRWVFLYKMGHGDPVEGKDYVFRHITDDGGVFHTVRQYTRHLAYDLEILCHPDGTPAEIPSLPETK